MAQSVGIFRKISQRPHQRAIRARFVVGGPGAVVEDVQSIVFPHRQFKNPEPRFQRQPKRQIPLGVYVPPPVVRPPGFLEIISARTERYGKLLARDRFDYKAAQRVYHIPTFAAPAPGWNRRRLPQRQQIRRFMFRQILRAKIVVAVVPSADLGWLVSWIIKRAHGHNIRR